MHQKIMKTRKAILFCFIIALSSCEKENLPTDNQTISQDTKIIEVKKWFEKSNPELSILKYSKQIDWDHAIVTDGAKGKVVEVPIVLEDDLMLNFNNDNAMVSYHRLLFQSKNGNSFKVSDVMFFTKDKNFDNTNKEINFYSGDKKFDGSIIVLDVKNELTKPRQYEKGEEVKPIKGDLTARAPVTPICVYLGWYTEKNYGPTVFEPIALIGCFGGSSGDADYGGPHSGGGGSGGGNGNLIMPPPPDLPINDIKKYLSCFTSANANLSVFAERMNILDKNVGHAFISISQGNNTMVFGYYPQNGNLKSLTGPGIMGENGGHYYNVSATMGISGAQLQQIINLSQDYQNADYDLSFNNCSDFATQVLNITGVSTTGFLDTPNTVAEILLKLPNHTSNANYAPKTKRTCL
jgi:hypothetical protein